MRIPDKSAAQETAAFFGESVPVLETTRYRLFEGLTALARKEDGAWAQLARRMKKLEADIARPGSNT